MSDYFYSMEFVLASHVWQTVLKLISDEENQ